MAKVVTLEDKVQDFSKRVLDLINTVAGGTFRSPLPAKYFGVRYLSFEFGTSHFVMGPTGRLEYQMYIHIPFSVLEGVSSEIDHDPSWVCNDRWVGYQVFNFVMGVINQCSVLRVLRRYTSSRVQLHMGDFDQAVTDDDTPVVYINNVPGRYVYIHHNVGVFGLNSRIFK